MSELGLSPAIPRLFQKYPVVLTQTFGGDRHEAGAAPSPLRANEGSLCLAPSLPAHRDGGQALSAVRAGKKAAVPLERGR